MILSEAVEPDSLRSCAHDDRYLCRGPSGEGDSEDQNPLPSDQKRGPFPSGP